MGMCARCGGPLPVQTGKGRRRKMCATCSPSRPRRKPDPPAAATAAVAAEPGTVLDATRAALADARVLASPMGRAALVLAARIDDPDEPLTAVAASVKQLRDALAAVLAATETAPADPNDEFTRKRIARERGA